MEGIRLEIKRKGGKSEGENSTPMDDKDSPNIPLAVVIMKGKEVKDIILALAIFKIMDSQIKLENSNVAACKQEKWIKHYSNFHKILLVGEGDFSFAACLATAFGSATNMVAASLDSLDEVMAKYSRARIHLEKLKEMGCTIIHQVDVNTMRNHSLLKHTSFDRIVFNFPHAPLIWREHVSLQIELHQEVVKGFLRNSREMLSKNGEAHVTHKTAHPFSDWKIERLGEEVGMSVWKKVRFEIGDYPGYQNKRGSGNFCDLSFPVGECCTFMFAAI